MSARYVLYNTCGHDGCRADHGSRNIHAINDRLAIEAAKEKHGEDTYLEKYVPGPHVHVVAGMLVKIDGCSVKTLWVKD